jgi:AraC-like DNA-binding protein
MVPVRSGMSLVALLHAGSRNRSRLPPQKYCAALKLLGIFAVQLGGLGNQMLVQKQSGEPPVISRAKDFISQHYCEDISSGLVAKELHLSRFYFCTLFKRSTGVTVTEYLTRVRIERVKELLLNPNLRISEIAFQTGFQSLTHFNRVFLKFTGHSPTEYRARLREA